MNIFAGTWVDENKDSIKVSGDWNVVSVKYSNARGPFQGYSLSLSAETLTVNFTDDAPFTGVLSKNQILWSNDTTWTRA